MKESIFGNMYRFCPVCRVHIHIETVHAEDDCWLLQQDVHPERERITVPEVFHRAFEEDKNEKMNERHSELCCIWTHLVP